MNSLVAPLLDFLLARTGASGAVLYRFESETEKFHPVASAGEDLFEASPEFAYPLRLDGELLGLLSFLREDGQPLAIDIGPISEVITALLEREHLRRELRHRKLIERAKGIVQERRQLSEEAAYLFLRNTSRRRRIPMAQLAEEIIENSPRRIFRSALAS